MRWLVDLADLRFSYQSFPLQLADAVTGSDSVCRPVIPVRLIYRDKTLAGYQYTALIDSGADWCLFHAEIGTVLEIPIERGQPVSFVGVGGTEQIAYVHPVKLEVGPWVVAIRAGFVSGLRFPHGLLGQAGFFDQVVVTHYNAPPDRFVDLNPIK